MASRKMFPRVLLYVTSTRETGNNRDLMSSVFRRPYRKSAAVFGELTAPQPRSLRLARVRSDSRNDKPLLRTRVSPNTDLTRSTVLRVHFFDVLKTPSARPLLMILLITRVLIVQYSILVDRVNSSPV